jgi:hypothetical protein
VAHGMSCFVDFVAPETSFIPVLHVIVGFRVFRLRLHQLHRHMAVRRRATAAPQSRPAWRTGRRGLRTPRPRSAGGARPQPIARGARSLDAGSREAARRRATWGSGVQRRVAASPRPTRAAGNERRSRAAGRFRAPNPAVSSFPRIHGLNSRATSLYGGEVPESHGKNNFAKRRSETLCPHVWEEALGARTFRIAPFRRYRSRMFKLPGCYIARR